MEKGENMYIVKTLNHLCLANSACATMFKSGLGSDMDWSPKIFKLSGRRTFNSWSGSQLKRYCLLVFFMLALPVYTAQAQDGSKAGVAEAVKSGAHELALMAQEPPLTQADLDTIILLAGTPDEEDAAVLAASGLTPLRLDLTLSKVSFGMLMLSGLDSSALEGTPEVFLPNEEELALIAANVARFSEVDLGVSP